MITEPRPVGPDQPASFTIGGPFWGKAGECTPILRTLSDWFGIEEAIVKYSEEIDRLPTWLVCDQEQIVGFLSLKQHNAYSAEIYVMGIKQDWQRHGLGRVLVTSAEAWLKNTGAEYLQVKTLGPSHPDEGYARTRAFYEAMGFRPLEEFTQIWDEHNPCLILITRL